MRKVISARDVEEMIRRGDDLRSIPPDAILTPAARDLLREISHGLDGPYSTRFAKPLKGGLETGQESQKEGFRNVTAHSPSEQLEAFLRSEELAQFRRQMLDIGRRLWQREYVDGNGGNMAIKVKPDIVLCTPTLVSKGFMSEEDLCLVDMEGNQLAGSRRRTSEILMHLEIFKRQPKAVATVHCHPPYATAFAVAGVQPPSCLVPELEVFVGRVPIAPYETPGTKEMALKVAELADKHNTILMGNHGAVAWSHLSLEDAYFKMEILESYCRTIWVASQLGRPLQAIPEEKVKDLLEIKKRLGVPDPRLELSECKLCDNDGWSPAARCVVPQISCTQENDLDPEAELLVRIVTDKIMQALSS